MNTTHIYAAAISIGLMLVVSAAMCLSDRGESQQVDYASVTHSVPTSYLASYENAFSIVFNTRDVQALEQCIKSNSIMRVDPLLRFAARQRLADTSVSRILFRASEPIAYVRLLFVKSELSFKRIASFSS